MRRAKGNIRVFTFKEGVLSAVAHDLQFHFEQFAITLEGEAVHGEFDLKSLSLDGPVRDGAVHPEEYDAGKRAEVEKAMHRGQVEIQPSRWGVAQYKALLGAIRLKDTVRIAFELTDT